MRKKDRITSILIYIAAQAAWFCLLALWIFWFVSNYLIFIEVGERLSPRVVFTARNIISLIIGILLLAALMTSMTMIFNRLNKQMKLTRLYDNFIANVTHELKSPLASIQMYLETLSNRDVPEDKQKEFIGIMMKDTRRLESQINTILEISGLEDRKKVYNPRLHYAEELILSLCNETVDALNLPPDTCRIAGDGACYCRVDENALRIVFVNLFDNAAKYSLGKLRIDVTIGRTEKKFLIEIKDNGIGIPKNNLKEVFKKFRRLYYPEIPSVKGTGLGLYWVREIIRYHRGKIIAASEGRGRGTTFRIQLPVESSSGHNTEEADMELEKYE